MAETCAVCNKVETEATKLLQCSRCKKAKYCCKECQGQDWPSHKEKCKVQNYILKIDLNPGDITNPSISRTLSCPANSTFSQLHMALQVAFDWAGSHTYDFKIKDPNADPEAEPDIMTYINRRMMQDRAQFDGGPVPDMGPRQNFLRIVEEDPRGPMGFMSGKGIDAMHNGSRVHSQTPEVVGSKIKLSKVFENKEYKGAGIEYEYDFGDCWEHEITVVGRADPTSKFVCIDGEGHGAAEDAGSVRGWNELVEAYRTANPNKDQREKRKWFETQASNSDPRGLGNGRDAFWDKAAINAALSH